MFYRNFASFLSIFVAAVIATVHNDSNSVTGSDLEATAYPLTTQNPEPSTREPDRQVTESTAVDLGALLDAGDGAVVTLVAGDTRLAAHKAVLTARSPVFAATLQRMMLEASTSDVAIPDVEGPVLRQMLAYMYTLQGPQLPSIASQLLVAADRYGLSGLKAHCEQQVAAQLSVETAVTAAVLAVRHSCSSLMQAAVAYIRSHILHVMATQGWTDAINSQPEDLMKVIQLLSHPPAEASVPAAGGSGTAPTTQPHSDHSGHRGQTPASAAQPTASLSTAPSDDAVSRMRTPAPGDGRTTPTTEPHSDHSDNGRTPASAGQTTAAGHTTPTDDAAVSLLHTPAPAASRPTPTTQPHSDHSGRTPASAAPTMAARDTHTPDHTAISRLRSLSADEKGRKLIEAAREGAVEEVEALLAAGADVGARNKWMLTALHCAAAGGHVEVARRLLAAGAEVQARDRWQGTPLHVAAMWGHAAVVQLLAEEASADPNARDDIGRTPLHWAANEGHVEVARRLLAAGAEVDARNGWQGTPLHVAANKSKAEVASALLQAGADRRAADNWGRTPLDHARIMENQQLIDLLTTCS